MSTDDQAVNKHLPRRQATLFKDLWEILKIWRRFKHEYYFLLVCNVIGKIRHKPENPGNKPDTI